MNFSESTFHAYEEFLFYVSTLLFYVESSASRFTIVNNLCILIRWKHTYTRIIVKKTERIREENYTVLAWESFNLVRLLKKPLISTFANKSENS